MTLNIDKEVAQLQRMTVGQLQEKFAEVCGEPARSRNKQWMVKRVAWKLQAREYGGLSERALQRAAEIADTCDLSDLRLTAPKTWPFTDSVVATDIPSTALDRRLPKPGTLLMRRYKGQNLCVKVLTDGFEFEGERFKSLSAVARRITGSAWNGFLFFNLRKKGADS